MPRPRTHVPDTVLDAVEALAAQSGPASVTIRAVAAATGVSNGAIYHSFGSRAELLGRTWLRAARRYLAMQTELVDAHLSTSPETTEAIEAVLAAAETPVGFAKRYDDSSTLLLMVSREQLLGDELPAELTAELAGTDKVLIALMVRLTRALWGRGDAAAVDVMTTCLVDLPTAILLRRRRLDTPLAREHLRAAVRAVLEVGPPLISRSPVIEGAAHDQPHLP